MDYPERHPGRVLWQVFVAREGKPNAQSRSAEYQVELEGRFSNSFNNLHFWLHPQNGSALPKLVGLYAWFQGASNGVIELPQRSGMCVAPLTLRSLLERLCLEHDVEIVEKLQQKGPAVGIFDNFVQLYRINTVQGLPLTAGHCRLQPENTFLRSC